MYLCFTKYLDSVQKGFPRMSDMSRKLPVPWMLQQDIHAREKIKLGMRISLVCCLYVALCSFIICNYFETPPVRYKFITHYDDVIMTMLASQISSLPVVCSIVYSDVNQRKHQSSASLAFVREIHRGPVNFPHKWPVTRKMFPFDDVIMSTPKLLVPSV